MAVATLVNSIKVDATKPYIICEYNIDSIAADSTSSELVSISLPNKNILDYLHVPNVSTSGVAYIIKPTGLIVSSLSRNLDMSILNKNDIELLNTINEVLKYTAINKRYQYDDFNDFIIRNRDTVLTNELYLFFYNHDTIATGTIRLELSYLAMQEREF